MLPPESSAMTRKRTTIGPRRMVWSEGSTRGSMVRRLGMGGMLLIADRNAGYCAGIATSGRFSFSPLSASVKNNITAVSARFVARSPSSTQYQVEDNGPCRLRNTPRHRDIDDCPSSSRTSTLITNRFTSQSYRPPITPRWVSLPVSALHVPSRVAPSRSRSSRSRCLLNIASWPSASCGH